MTRRGGTTGPRKGQPERRQCAWCGAIAAADGIYAPGRPAPAGGATHGICPTCAAELLRQFYDASAGPAA